VKIKHRINMSSPNAMSQVGHLFMRFTQAIHILSGIQQAPMSCEPEEIFQRREEEFKEGILEIKDIATEIFVALTGKNLYNSHEDDPQDK